MPDAVVLSASRTPIGKFRGRLSEVPATELGAIAVRGALDRAGLGESGDRVDEVIMGNVLSAGVGQAPARQAALKAGLSNRVSALTINKVCGSGLQAVMLASQAIRAGDAQLVVAGGMESMSLAPLLLTRDRADDVEVRIDSMLADGLQCSLSGLSMGGIAERLARSDGITRAQQDAYAVESHRRAIAATTAGRFDRELAAVKVTSPEVRTITTDEGPRKDTSLEKLASLRPVFAEDGTVTAGNASMISDGAAALVVASADLARGLPPPLARILASATAGGPPEDLFIAPVDAVRMAVDRAGLSLADIGLFEINEAFAVQTLACLARLDLSPDRVNVHGGAIALGHPIGASGARVAVTLLHAMRERNIRYGVAALCLGGGNAVATVFESCDQ